jgi:nucleoside 2-deoxyribosyltransferase
MAKAFFGCAMRVGYPNAGRQDLLEVRNAIEELGYELVSKHQLEEGIVEREHLNSPKYVHDRDYQWLREADLAVFEISNPSTGAGAEISDMIHLEKPVLCLFRKEAEEMASYYIRGKKGSGFVKSAFECQAYGTAAEAKQLIKEFAEKHLKGEGK